MEGLFAGTPPLEALRLLVSLAATVHSADKGRKVVMVNDMT